MKIKIQHKNITLVELDSMEYIPYEDEYITIDGTDYVVTSRYVETNINGLICEQIVNIDVLTDKEYNN